METQNNQDNQMTTKQFAEEAKKLMEKYAVSETEQKTLLEKIWKNELTSSEKMLNDFFVAYNITIEDKYAIMEMLRKIKDRINRQNVIKASAAAIMSRQLSHSIWRNMLLQKNDKEFNEFIKFCNPDIQITAKWENKFQELFIKDCESIKEHPLNKAYQILRKNGASVIEAIQQLPRKEEALKNMLSEDSILADNITTLNGSKMGDTSFCLWRTNTILWIIAMNEGVQYLDEHFEYGEVLKDGLEDLMERTPKSERDQSYLNEILNYEDPHMTLIYKEGKESIEIDPNHLALRQMWVTDPINNETFVHQGNISDIAYEVYFLNYLNEMLIKNPNTENKNEILERIQNYNNFVGWSEILIKRMIGYNNTIRNEKEQEKRREELQEFAIHYPSIKNKFWYKLMEQENNPKKLQEFIKQKYWPQFSLLDVLQQYWV